MPIPTYDQFIDLQRVGGSGDAGIDGVISLDKLGLEKGYIQAKR
jgi:restriction system protein